jgi:hypothetical protein
MENRKFLTKGRIIIGLLIAVMVLPTVLLGLDSLRSGDQWLYFHSEGRRGRVVEVDTNAPVEGVVVIAYWSALPMLNGPHPIMLLFWLNPLWHLGDSLTRKLGSGKIEVTVTDKEGKFIIPAWSEFQPWTFNAFCAESPNMCIYKPGYKTIYTNFGNWMMDKRQITADLNNLPFTKSLTAKELEEDYDDYWLHSSYKWGPSHKDFQKIDKLIEKALNDLHIENKNEIQKHMGFAK